MLATLMIIAILTFAFFTIRAMELDERQNRKTPVKLRRIPKEQLQKLRVKAYKYLLP